MLTRARSHIAKILSLAGLWIISNTAFADSYNSASRQLWLDSIGHSIEFFDAHAWDEESGSYFSEITYDGHVKSTARHLMALSRMVYGLSYASQHDLAQLSRAKSAADYLLKKMIRTDPVGPYFVGTIGADGQAVLQDQLVVNEQAYGLCGLVALYDVTKDEQLRQQIGELYESFVRRFKDSSEAGGFFDLYDLHAGAPVRTKSYNSTVYVATSFLMEFSRVTGRLDAASTAGELADIVKSRFLDRTSGWIFENFDEQWRPWADSIAGLPVDQALSFVKDHVPAGQQWQFQKVGTELRTIGVAGHNFQAAWFLTRMSLDARYDVERRAQWAEGARTILMSMLRDGGNGPVDRVNGGIFDVFQRETSETMWHTNKAWWQQAEAILALTLATKSGVLDSEDARHVRDQAVDFYFTHFVDRDLGGEFSELTREGEPTKDNGLVKDKGLWGKSTYHTVELARYMLAYIGHP